MITRLLLGFALALGLGVLAACKSSEERAEEHYQTALEHIETGDYARAVVEFQNVFKLNGNHLEARLTFAQMQQGRGLKEEAYSQYLRLVEQDPQNLEGRLALIAMAVERNDWDEVGRHSKAAAGLAPENPSVRGAQTNIRYREAVAERNLAAQQEAVMEAQKLANENPGLLSALQVVIDDHIRNEKWREARAVLETAISATPDIKTLYTLRLGVLNELGDTAEIEAQLLRMVAQFPQDDSIQPTLLNWYVSQNDTAGAEAFLRNRIATLPDPKDTQIELVNFLSDTKGPEAALAELDSLISAGTEPLSAFRSLRARLTFSMGNRDAAINEMEALLEQDLPLEEANTVKIHLAGMLDATDNPVGAHALIEQVLEVDTRNVDALKLKARWLIEDDQAGAAIITLREALGQSPQDAELMTLLARAHERNGDRDLMAEMLARAVEASGNAPDPSLRYATLLVRDNKPRVAEDVLLGAIRLQPQNSDLLAALGQTYLLTKDWNRLEQVTQTLKRIDTAETRAILNALTARKLQVQQRDDELQAFLENLATGDQAGLGTEIAVIRSHVNRGDVSAALAYAREALEKTPDSAMLRFIYGAVLVAADQPDAAMETYRAILNDAPQAEQVWRALITLQVQRGNPEGARADLTRALQALPDSPNLLLIQASLMEQDGDIDGAIAVYEGLYARNSNALVTANNLASLLTTYRDDAESLERAYRIARRLRGTQIGAFQDTYGWIAFRRGNLQDALDHLEPAARALPNDPRVQYHLAMTYSALGQTAQALAQFELVAGMIADQTPVPDYSAAVQTEVARLSQAGTTPASIQGDNN